MKLLSLHVDNFGKLHDFDYSFADGISCIEAENGYGKSTLAEFIRAMLYGLPAGVKGKQRAEDNVRSRYAPWQGGVYGGTLDIETSEHRLRIARTFGKTQANDTFSLTDLDTRLPSSAYGEDIGIKLFGIDSASYAKSTYLPQYEVEGLDKNNSQIVARLGNLLDASDDMSSFEKADGQLAEYMKQFKLFRGKGGLIDEANDRRDACIREIDVCEEALFTASAKRAELAAKEQRLAECESEVERLSAEIAAAQEEYNARLNKYERYRVLRGNIENAEAEVQKHKEFFTSGKPDQSDIDNIRRIIAKVESYADLDHPSYDTSEYREYYKIFGERPLEYHELEAFSARAKELKNEDFRLVRTEPPTMPGKAMPKLKKKKLLVSGMASAFAVGAALVIVGIVLPAWYLWVVGALLIAGGVGCLLAFLNEKKIERANDEEYAAKVEEYCQKSEEYNELTLHVQELQRTLEADLGRFYPGCPGGIDTVIGRLYFDNRRYNSLYSDKVNGAELRAERAAEREKYKKQLSDFFYRYGFFRVDDYDETLSVIREKSLLLTAAEEALAKKKAEAEQYAGESGNIVIEPTVPDLEEKTQTLRRLREESDRLRVEIGGVAQRIVQLEERAEPLPQKIDLAESLKADIGEYERKRRSAELAREYLLRAKNGLSSRYLRKMEDSFASSFSSIAGQSKAPEIDAELKLSFREGGEPREPIWYSTGYRAIMEICLRLSLIESLFEDEKPFLILDDPFCDLDADKLEKAKEMLKKLAENRQIIYLTCHPSRTIG